MLTTWVNKLKLEVIEEHEDGGCCIHIEWDDTDPDLAEWTSWGPDVQERFVLDALTAAVNNVSTTEHHVV